jgi:hypothetical protein
VACRINIRTIVMIRVLKRILKFIRMICRFNCLLHKLEIVSVGITAVYVTSNKIIRKERRSTKNYTSRRGFICFAALPY